MKSVHIICAKCGGTNLCFIVDLPDEEHCGVNLVCSDCGELTSIEEINEQLDEENK